MVYGILITGFAVLCFFEALFHPKIKDSKDKQKVIGAQEEEDRKLEKMAG